MMMLTVVMVIMDLQATEYMKEIAKKGCFGTGVTGAVQGMIDGLAPAASSSSQAGEAMTG
eukprot:10239767-Karenia_brevis.AAC.1